MMHMTRFRLLVGAGALLAVAAAYGCKDFLTNNAAPQGTLNDQTLMTAAGVEGTLIAAYRALDCNYQTAANWGCAVSDWVFGSVASDDAYEGSQPGDQPGIEQIELFHWSAPDAESYLSDKWKAAYDGVARSNATLRLLGSVQASNPSALPATDATGIRGEAMFLRAHYQFEAYRLWGNVPYYRENDSDFRKPNETKQQVVADLLRDLDSAIALLPSTPRNGQVGRATSWTATAYKGRVQVYAGDFAGALTTLRKVQSGGPYKLQPSFDQVWTGFPQYQNGPETIFAYQASINDGNLDGENSNYGERLNFPSTGSPFGCCGFHQPSQNLVNYFQVDAAGLPLALSNAAGWNANNSEFTAAQNTVPVDPRLDWTVGRSGVPFKDWGPVGAGWVRSTTHGGPYTPKKNVHEQSSGAQSTVGWTNTQLNAVNIHVFRYADLLLLLAEAEVEAGSLENARTIVNQIRARAGQKVQGPGTSSANIAVPINDPSITWATYRVGLYTTPWADQATARAAVRAERRVELAMEGQRFFDLRRWGIADVVLNGYLNGVGGGSEKARLAQFGSAEPVTAKHTEYPIPDNQLQLSTVGGKSTLNQNAGW
jgi:hypothetical protein